MSVANPIQCESMSKPLTVVGIAFIAYGVLIASPLRFLAPDWTAYPYVAWVLLISGAFMFAMGAVAVDGVGTAIREGTFWQQLRGFWWLATIVALIAISRLI